MADVADCVLIARDGPESLGEPPLRVLVPYGLRALSAYHRDHPYEFEVNGLKAVVDYEPAESPSCWQQTALDRPRP
jgi:hypothetical protein